MEEGERQVRWGGVSFMAREPRHEATRAGASHTISKTLFPPRLTRFRYGRYGATRRRIIDKEDALPAAM